MLKNSDQFCNPIFVIEDFSRQDPSSFSFYYSTLNKNYTVIRYISNDFHRAKIENPWVLIKTKCLVTNVKFLTTCSNTFPLVRIGTLQIERMERRKGGKKGRKADRRRDGEKTRQRSGSLEREGGNREYASPFRSAAVARGLVCYDCTVCSFAAAATHRHRHRCHYRAEGVRRVALMKGVY